jgi:hypothetical protein
MFVCHNFHQHPTAKRWSGLVVSLSSRQAATLTATSLLPERYLNIGSDFARAI